MFRLNEQIAFSIRIPAKDDHAITGDLMSESRRTYRRCPGYPRPPIVAMAATKNAHAPTMADKHPPTRMIQHTLRRFHPDRQTILEPDPRLEKDISSICIGAEIRTQRPLQPLAEPA